MCILMVTLDVALYCSVQADRAFVRARAFEIIPRGSPDVEVVRALAAYVGTQLTDNNAESIQHYPLLTRLNYLYNPFRVGPRTILTYGTHHVAPCQSHVRVFLGMANTHGFTVQRVNLHNVNLRGSHGLVEVYYAGRKGIVDPQYNILYRWPDGRPATLQELRDNPELVRENAAAAIAFENIPGRQRTSTPYPVDFDGYGFENAAYLNYGVFGSLRRSIWSFLAEEYGSDAPLIFRHPFWARYPAYRLAAIINPAFALFAAIWLFRRYIRGRRISRAAPLIPPPMVHGLS